MVIVTTEIQKSQFKLSGNILIKWDNKCFPHPSLVQCFAAGSGIGTIEE